MHELIRHYARSVYSSRRSKFSKNFKIQKIIFTKNVDNPPVIIVIYVCIVIIHDVDSHFLNNKHVHSEYCTFNKACQLYSHGV